jgi:hypothetical protein
VIPEGESEPAAAAASAITLRTVVAGGLIALGMVFLVRQLAPWLDERVLWALALVAIGLAVLVARPRRSAPR